MLSLPSPTSPNVRQQEVPDRIVFCSGLTHNKDLLQRIVHGVNGFRAHTLWILDDQGKRVLFQQANPDETPQQYDAFLRDGSGPYTLHTMLTGAIDGPRSALPHTATVTAKIADQTVEPRMMNEQHRFYPDIEGSQHEMHSEVKFTISDDAETLVIIEGHDPSNVIRVVRTPDEQLAFNDNLHTGRVNPAALLDVFRRDVHSTLLQYWHLHLKRSKDFQPA